jgi:hypothetical protein
MASAENKIKRLAVAGDELKVQQIPEARAV